MIGREGWSRAEVRIVDQAVAYGQRAVNAEGFGRRARLVASAIEMAFKWALPRLREAWEREHA